MTELPDRIVFEGPESFEINDPEVIEMVFRFAELRSVTPEEAIKLALVEQVENNSNLQRDPTLTAIVKAYRA